MCNRKNTENRSCFSDYFFSANSKKTLEYVTLACIGTSCWRICGDRSVSERLTKEYTNVQQNAEQGYWDDKFSKHAHPFLSASDRIRIHNSLFHKWTLNHLAKLAFSHSQLKTVQELSKKEWNHALWD